MYFDVAIVEVDRRVEYTDHIRPVCLPFMPIDDKDYLADDLVGGFILSSSCTTLKKYYFSLVSQVILAGFGLNEKGVAPDSLSVESLRVYTKSYCGYVRIVLPFLQRPPSCF